MRNKKQLIINADDFGWDEAANSAILDLLQTGNLSSTTILANEVRDDDLYDLIKIKNISTGIHVNLISGKPLSPVKKVTSLVDEKGMFFPSGKLMKRYVTGNIKSSEIDLEVANQIRRLRTAGVNISHADSHQHLHQFPFLGKVILHALKNNGIKKIRNINITEIRSKRAMVIRMFAKLTSRNLSPFSAPDGLIPYFSFANEYSMQDFSQTIQQSFKNKSCFEIMTHPGTLDRTGSYLKRAMEYKFWKNEDWKQILQEHNIQLINYHHL